MSAGRPRNGQRLTVQIILAGWAAALPMSRPELLTPKLLPHVKGFHGLSSVSAAVRNPALLKSFGHLTLILSGGSV